MATFVISNLLASPRNRPATELVATVLGTERTVAGPVFELEIRCGTAVMPLLVGMVRRRGSSIGAECGHRGFLVATRMVLGRA